MAPAKTTFATRANLANSWTRDEFPYVINGFLGSTPKSLPKFFGLLLRFRQSRLFRFEIVDIHLVVLWDGLTVALDVVEEAVWFTL
jgi:hypothetical protein